MVVLTTLALGAGARRFVLHLHDRARETHNRVDEALIGPTRGLIWVIGITWAAYVAAIFDALPALRDVLIIGMLTWFLLRFARAYEDRYIQDQDERGGEIDRSPSSRLLVSWCAPRSSSPQCSWCCRPSGSASPACYRCRAARLRTFPAGPAAPRSRSRAQAGQAACQSFGIDRSNLVHGNEATAFLEPTRHPPRISSSAGGHGGYDRCAQVLIKLVGRENETRASLANLTAGRWIEAHEVHVTAAADYHSHSLWSKPVDCGSSRS